MPHAQGADNDDAGDATLGSNVHLDAADNVVLELKVNGHADDVIPKSKVDHADANCDVLESNVARGNTDDAIVEPNKVEPNMEEKKVCRLHV